MAEVEIPLELIITEILTRLPIKSLTRFKCVSKSWNSLISSPSFITHHLKSNPNCNIIVTSELSPQSTFSASIHDNLNNYNTNLHFSEVNHPFKLNTDVCVIVSCNGILFISDSGNKTMFLYNPANNTYRLLPPIPSLRMKAFGFGYDSHTDDYKVIRVFQIGGLPQEICVYSMRDNVWKIFKDEAVCLRQYFLHRNAVGANGMLYFPPSVPEGLKSVLMCFDLRTEAFSVLDYPELECSDLHKVSRNLRELRGCLCLVVKYLCDDEQLLYADVWEMREGGKEGSWVKLFRIQKSEVVGKGERCMCLRVVDYSNDKGKVLVEVDCAWLGWYDLVTKKVEKVKIHGLQDEYSTYGYWSYGVMTCVESLVSVGNGNEVPGVTVSVSKGGSTP